MEKKNIEWILLTGGAGFIGSHTAEALLSKGYGVCVADSFNNFYSPSVKRDNIKCIEASAKGAGALKVYETDIRNLKGIDEIFASHNFSAVIHLAAYAGVRPSIENAPLYTDVNINGTLNILECMKKYGVSRLVFASSSSVYGNNKKVPFSETDFVDNPISPYAATKKAGELLCHTYSHLYGINSACLRFFTVYGPRQRPDLAIYKFTKLITENKEIPFFGDGSACRDYTFITDTVDGIVKALRWTGKVQGRFEVFNLGESRTISLSEMVSEIEKSTGKKAALNKLPMQPGDVYKTFADISKAKEILGYNPTFSFAEGIKIFTNWYTEKFQPAQ
ncbi:MAG: GDP-mannose 4,6-dehydratase [Clostridiales bacterium]|nr:GDP-mannose 4,6-dehydratase [Clostridiales bacterium]